MPVSLETSIKRFIGDSSDAKPRLGLQSDNVTVRTSNDLPIGSTLYLKDLGIIERWDGAVWNRDPPDHSSDRIIESLTAIRLEIAALRVGMIGAGACQVVSPEDIEDFVDA